MNAEHNISKTLQKKSCSVVIKKGLSKEQDMAIMWFVFRPALLTAMSWGPICNNDWLTVSILFYIHPSMDAEIILDRLCENISSNTLSESLQ